MICAVEPASYRSIRMRAPPMPVSPMSLAMSGRVQFLSSKDGTAQSASNLLASIGNHARDESASRFDQKMAPFLVPRTRYSHLSLNRFRSTAWTSAPNRD